MKGKILLIPHLFLWVFIVPLYDCSVLFGDNVLLCAFIDYLAFIWED